MQIINFLYWKSGICPDIDRSFNFGSTCNSKLECITEIEEDISGTIEKLQKNGYKEVQYNDSTGIISCEEKGEKIEAYRFGIKKVVRKLTSEEEKNIAKNYIENLTGKKLEDFIKT